MRLTAPPYTWTSILSIALQHKKTLISAHIIAILAAIASVPIPLLLPLMVDEVLLQQPGVSIGLMNQFYPADWQLASVYIATMLAITLTLRLLTVLLGVWQMQQFTFISKDITFHLRRHILLRLHHVSLSEYETLGSGKIASHLITDMDAIDLFVGASVSRFLVALLSILGAAAVLLWIHWPLALFILCFNPIIIYFTTVMGKRVKRLKKRENAAYALFQESMAETLDAIQEIRAANRDQHYLLRVIQQAKHIKQHSGNFTWKSDAAARLSFVIFLFGFDMFRALSMLLVLYSDLSVGFMFAVFGYLWFMMSPVQELLGIQYAYHSANAALSRINQLLNMPQEPQYPHLHNPFISSKTLSIQTQALTFCYQQGPRVLDQIEINIHAGERVALVGTSGSGKTTLVHVLLGLYTPDSGDILFNGVSFREIGLDVIRDHVATVLQHPALFNDTIRMNLTLGKQHTEADLWQALRIAQLDHVIQALSDGLDSIIGNNGIRLSGGQRQRIAIARMVLSQPKIVIMDEATSSLDITTEFKLHEALETFLAGKTTLIIAHRLSAIKQADRVLVFDQGRIVEDGHHDALILNNGLYASLYAQRIRLERDSNE